MSAILPGLGGRHSCGSWNRHSFFQFQRPPGRTRGWWPSRQTLTTISGPGIIPGSTSRNSSGSDRRRPTDEKHLLASHVSMPALRLRASCHRHDSVWPQGPSRTWKGTSGGRVAGQDGVHAPPARRGRAGGLAARLGAGRARRHHGAPGRMAPDVRRRLERRPGQRPGRRSGRRPAGRSNSAATGSTAWSGSATCCTTTRSSRRPRRGSTSSWTA